MPFSNKIQRRGYIMTDTEQKKAAGRFAEVWKGKGYEKGQSQAFWLSLLRDVFGVEHPEEIIVFEEQVHLDHTSFIDGRIPSTKVLIEQKGLGKDLNKPIRQSDGSLLNPFQQAKKYILELPVSQHPRWVVTCNFAEFYIYDMERPGGEPEKILLADLEREYYRLRFLVDTGIELPDREADVSFAAGEIVGLLYDAFLKQYKDPSNENTLRSLNILCVRLVFCLYAEDAGLFGRRDMFRDYLSAFDTNHSRKALIELFRVLDTKPEERDPYLEPELAAFPYVNGGLFRDEDIEIPMFTDEIRELLLTKASRDFNWSEISPTIFGAVFESTLNPETRRSGGMHYTSIENIHKVIDPLFLDRLKKEFDETKVISVPKTRQRKLEEFQKKLGTLIFLDPACGSGNFLTETYLSLRRLENEILLIMFGDQVKIGTLEYNPIQVSISQFYGVEINDFAVTVAKTALWIAESQMLRETEYIIKIELDFLPLKTNAYIVEGNALRMDWEHVVPKDKLNYIMGNPPFVGQQLRSSQQSDDMIAVFGAGAPETKLDYVLCWYKKAFELIKSASNHKICAAFVSTNSICQGESVPTFWKSLFADGVDIGFAYNSFKWKNESSEVAAVYCVIVGFSSGDYGYDKYLFDNGAVKKAEHINAYLQDAPDVWITSRKNNPPVGMPKMTKGSEPADGGNLFLNSDERNEFIRKYPSLEKYIRPFVGGDEYLSNRQGEFSRYCFWMVDANPSDYAHNIELKKRFASIARKRAESSAERIRKKADFPYLFCQIRQPTCDYLIFPQHTTSDRKYIPIGFMSSNIIAGNACYIVPNASIYLFGILTSNVHMAWTRLVCGRLGNGYRYSPAIYNNFPFPSPSDEQKAKIEKTAQSILNARALYQDNSLAVLYDDVWMPSELRRAHQENDRAVMQAYGFSVKDTTESRCVTELMKMYQAETENF